MELFARARRAVRHGGKVLDIGAGIRPQTVVRADESICVEPFGPYADRLEAMGCQVIRGTAIEALTERPNVDTVVLLDVIEHMEKPEGMRVLHLAQGVARQVVVFTPLGFIPQTGDAWGLGGEHWQEHRSGWEPVEFKGWIILEDGGFHVARGGAFFAIWTR